MIDSSRDRIVGTAAGSLDETIYAGAGAGTGKTQALVERIANLVTMGGVKPENIAAITFTVAAASELRQRVRQQLEERLDEAGKTAAKNDFSALFEMIHGEDEILGVKSYLKDYDNVFILASCTSVYRQAFPDNSIDLGFSSTALHWLSEKPGIISGHIHAVGAKGSELKAFAVQAKKDWQTILLHRAKELVPGGKLVFVNFCIDEQGRYLGNTAGVNMFDTYNAIWLELVADGTVTKEEYTNVAFPQFYRTAEEFTAPFSDPNGEARKAGLNLDHIESRIVECPHAATYRETKDLDSFVRSYVNMLRSWSESTFYNGLDPSRPSDERNRIVDLFYGKYEERIRRTPDEHTMDHVHYYMVISKAEAP